MSVESYDIPPRVAYALAAVFAVLLFAPSYSSFATEYLGNGGGDMNIAYRHFFDFCYDSVRGGTLPLWNPFVFCGAPFLPGTSATLWYPPNSLILLTLPRPLAVNLCIVFHAVLLATGCVYWVRVRGGSAMAALFAGLVAPLCAALSARIVAGHFTIVCTAAWIPVVFALQERALRGRARQALPLAVAAAAMFLAGHMQVVYYAALLLGVNALIFVLGTGPDRLARAKRVLASHGAAAGIAACLAAVEFLPVLSVVSHSARNTAARDAGWLRFFSMPVENLATFVSPELLGGANEYFGRWFWWETCCYIGVLPFALCVLAVVMNAFRRQSCALPVLFVLSVALGIAGNFEWLAPGLKMLPGWVLFRGHAKIFLYTMVFGVVLASAGFDALRSASSRHLAICVSGGLVVLALAAVISALILDATFWRDYLVSISRAGALTMPARPDQPAFLQMCTDRAKIALFWVTGIALVGGAIVLCATWFGVSVRSWAILVLAVAEASVFGVGWTNTRFAVPAGGVPESAMRALREARNSWRAEVPAVRLDEAMTYRFDVFGGNDVFVSKYYNTFASAYFGTSSDEPHLTVLPDHHDPLLDVANVGLYALSAAASDRAKQGLTLVNSYDGVSIYQRSAALPRAYVVSGTKWVSDDEKAIMSAMMSDIDYRKEVLLVGEGNSEAAQADAVPAEARYVGLNEVRLVAPGTGWLVLVDSYYPGWKAYVGGRETPILRANCAFRAVKVQAGQEVVFRYVSWPFRVGASISLLTLTALLVWSGFAWGKPSRKVTP